MKSIKKIAIVSTGVIGASWAAFFVYKGFEVTAYDPAEDAEANLINRVSIYLQDLYELDKGTYTSEDIAQILSHLHFTHDLSQAVKDADFIQESGPERLDIKCALYLQITQNCPADTIIASSSSGLRVSDIQTDDIIHPERVVLGHPFNPPHLLPLVEIIGGEKTTAEYKERARQFYQQLGKKPILINKEVKGHVANRLQAALWREAFYLVSNDICSAEDVDTAITNGPGLRWAIYGPYLNMQLANHKGFKTAMHHLGEPMMQWWADMHPYQLNAEEIDKFDLETQKILEKLGDFDLQAKRDEALIDILP